MASWWQAVVKALRGEKKDLDRVVDELTERAHATLDEREREMQATPEEKLAMEQERAEQIDADLDAVRKRIEQRDRES